MGLSFHLKTYTQHFYLLPYVFVEQDSPIYFWCWGCTWDYIGENCWLLISLSLIIALDNYNQILDVYDKITSSIISFYCKNKSSMSSYS